MRYAFGQMQSIRRWRESQNRDNYRDITYLDHWLGRIVWRFTRDRWTSLAARGIYQRADENFKQVLIGYSSRLVNDSVKAKVHR